MKYTAYYVSMKNRKQIYIGKQSNIAKKWHVARFLNKDEDGTHAAMAPGIPAKASQSIRRGEYGSVLPLEQKVSDEKAPQDRQDPQPTEEKVPNSSRKIV